MTYLDIKQILDRKAVLNKKGTLSAQEIKLLIKEWHNTRTEADLNEEMVRMEMKALESKIRKYNVPQLGDIPEEREDGNIRILVCQMGGCVSKEIREVKIAAVKKLIRQYNINVIAFLDLNFNWSKVNSSANLASWLHNKEQEMRCVAAHNTQEQLELFSKHQPGGAGIICRNKFLQYLQKPLVDPRGLGRWCSWPFSCNRATHPDLLLPTDRAQLRSKD